MKKEFDPGTYEYFLECLKEIKPQYCEEIEQSLIKDEAIFKLGFSKHPIYTVEVNISEDDIKDILKYTNALHKRGLKYFDHYCEFHNIICSLKNEQSSLK